MLVPVVGPSGAGKDTLMAAARARLAADPRFVFARRCITRPAEAGGEDHEPMTQPEFAAAQQARAFMLWWEAHGLLYGIPRRYAGDLAAGRVVVANLSRSVVGQASRHWPVRVLRITAPPELLARRLAARGREEEAEISARLLPRDATLPEDVAVETVVNDGTVEEGVARVLAALSRAAAAAPPPGRARPASLG